MDATTEDGQVELSAVLREWVAHVAGAPVIAATRVVGGGSREAWSVEVGGSDGRRLFLRREAGHGPMYGTDYTIAREGAVYLALRATSVPVAPVVAVNADEDAILMEHVEGESFFPAVGDDTTKAAVAEEFATILAKLHALDPESLALPPMPRPRTGPEHATFEIDLWEDLHRERGRFDPLVTFGFRWLRARIPSEVDRTVVVQGDTGPGNFMCRDGRIVAVTDWELAHLGDPMEDLAWIVTRCILQPFVPLPAWMVRYEELSGIRLDPARLDFWVVFNVLRCVIGEGVVVASGETNPERGMIYGLMHLHRRLTLQAMARYEGRPERPLPAPGPAANVRTERTPLYALVGEVIDDVLLPRVDDPMSAHRGRAASRLLRHLTLCDSIGPALDDAETAAIDRLLGAESEDVVHARELLDAAVARRELEDSDVQELLRADCDRRTPLFAPMLGRLATAEIPRWR